MCDTTIGTKHLIEVEIGRTVKQRFDDVLRRIEQALQKEGFGVLTRVDMQETLRTKLGVERAPFVILGACNPQLAHRALGLEPRLGLFLPCHVAVREVAPGTTRVEATNPAAMMEWFPEADLAGVALEARRRLGRALETFDVPVPT